MYNYFYNNSMRPSHSEVKQNFLHTTRGVSLGNTKRQPHQFAKIITQVDENGYQTNTNYQTLADNAYERIHSPLPSRKPIIDNLLIPLQKDNKTGKKTLILDLDETLVHSAFEPFGIPADIELKVIIIF